MEISSPTDTVRTLPLELLAAYPKLLSAHAPEEGALLNDPIETLAGLRPLDRFTPEHRAALVGALLEDLERWGAPVPAIEAARLLEGEDVYAVVTGQQAGIATGPLYTLYKAVGAAAACEKLAARFPEARFVPVFWIEADDHDFDEARSLGLLDKSGAFTTIRYDDEDRSPRHVGDRRVSRAGLDALLATLRETLLPTDFTEATLALVEDAYGREGETLADGFARAFYALAGETPIVLASSRNAGLKRLASDIFAREAADPTPLFEAVTRRTEALKERGAQVPISPKPGALFLTHREERRGLEPVDGGYAIRGTDGRITTAEAVELARTAPERFSPNVVLRPIVQDAIFPTAIYLGGPSELAYLGQLRDAYELFGMRMPASAPRPFVMLVEPKAKRVLDGLPVSVEEFLAEGFEAAPIFTDGELEERVEATEREVAGELRALLGRFDALVGRIDPTLEKALGATAANAQKGVEDFAKRLRAALKRKHQTEIDRLESARTLLLPQGQLQERVLNPLYFVDKFGIERFRAALAAIDIRPGYLQMIEI